MQPTDAPAFGSVQDATLYARGMACPLGKFSEDVRTYVDANTYGMLARLANEQNTTLSEFVRDILYLVVHQKTPAELAANGVRKLLVGTGLDEAPKSP